MTFGGRMGAKYREWAYKFQIDVFDGVHLILVILLKCINKL